MTIDADYDNSLEFVRHELDVLVEARCLNGLRPSDSLQYLSLCMKEQELLRKAGRLAS
jgi:hypothetical protein